MSDRVRFWGVAVVVAFWAVLCFPSAVRASPFLSAEIDAALDARAEFLRGLELTEADFFELEARPESFDGDKLAAKLASIGATGPAGAWRYYVGGALSGGEAAVEHYGRAIDAAAADAGTLWLLAVSFIRNDQFDSAIESFTALEKNLLAGGAAGAPFLSMQLMLLGNAEALRSQSKRAEFCYRWARRFDKGQSWWAYRRGAVDFPANAASATQSFIAESGNVLATSWRAQIAAAAGAHRFLSATAFIFICAVMFVFAVKYLPSGVHAIGDTLFGGASPRFKVISGVAVALSTLILGIVPGLWVVAFLVCRFAAANEKKLLILTCALLALAPLNGYVARSLGRHAEPSSPAALLDRAVSEGYSDDLHKLISACAKSNPDNYACQLALAICGAKNRDYTVISGAMSRALQLAPDDPMALLYAGNISFLSGSEDGMTRHYGELLKLRPDCAEAKFNLSLAYIDKGGFTSADMINEAAKMDPDLISDFMRDNERYFSGDVPPLRRVIQPSVSPAYFWSRLFVADPAKIFEQGKAKFFGVDALPAFGLCAAAFVLLLILNATVWSESKTKAKVYFVCRICGRLLCRKCRRGTLCSACYKASLDSHNSAAAMYNLQRTYHENTLRRKDVLRCLTGIAVPGADRLYVGETVAGPALSMLVPSAVYAAFYCALTFGAYYPASTVIRPVYFVSILLIYNITVLIKQLKWLSSTLKMRAKMAVRA